MRTWNELTEEISGLPPEFSAAIASNRGELALCIDRPLTLSETQAVAKTLKVLLDTNRALQTHSALLAESTDQIRGHAIGLLRKLESLNDKANFREDMEDNQSQ